MGSNEAATSNERVERMKWDTDRKQSIKCPPLTPTYPPFFPFIKLPLC